MEKIELTYNIPDVEHMGDVNSEEFRLRDMGAEILRTDIDWGSEEIEEAVITIFVNKSDVQKFLDYGCRE